MIANFQIPPRLLPENFARLFGEGVLDVGALLCYGALLLIAWLFVRRLFKRTVGSAIVLVVVVAAVALIVAFSDWPDRVPPLYFPLSQGAHVGDPPRLAP